MKKFPAGYNVILKNRKKLRIVSGPDEDNNYIVDGPCTCTDPNCQNIGQRIIPFENLISTGDLENLYTLLPSNDINFALTNENQVALAETIYLVLQLLKNRRVPYEDINKCIVDQMVIDYPEHMEEYF